jgi:hypothetical protein
MTDLRVITRDGGERILEETTVNGFAADLRGPLLRPATAITTNPARSGTA